jgi:hypothetical protein
MYHADRSHYQKVKKLKYGDTLYKYSWHRAQGRYGLVDHSFRFRIDPVPGVHKLCNSYFTSYYKTPKTSNEKRQWYASEGYGRRKRSPRYLADSWDDYPRADRYYDSSWKKNKIRKQWMKKI